MVLFSKHLNSIVAAVFGSALCAHGAQVPQHLDVNQFSTTVEDVVATLPNEIFGALNKVRSIERNTSAAKKGQISPGGWVSVKKVNLITTRLSNDIIKKD